MSRPLLEYMFCEIVSVTNGANGMGTHESLLQHIGQQWWVRLDFTGLYMPSPPSRPK